MKLRRAVPTVRLALALSLWAALFVGCALPEASATQTPPATAGLPPEAATPNPTSVLSATPSPLPKLGPLPAGTIALYGLGQEQSLDLYALRADGSATSLGVRIAPRSLLSHDGRWVVHLDAPGAAARAAVIDNLEDGRSYAIPLGQVGCMAGLWAFDREGTRLASVEVGMDYWA